MMSVWSMLGPVSLMRCVITRAGLLLISYYFSISKIIFSACITAWWKRLLNTFKSTLFTRRWRYRMSAINWYISVSAASRPAINLLNFYKSMPPHFLIKPLITNNPVPSMPVMIISLSITPIYKHAAMFLRRQKTHKPAGSRSVNLQHRFKLMPGKALIFRLVCPLLPK